MAVVTFSNEKTGPSTVIGAQAGFIFHFVSTQLY